MLIEFDNEKNEYEVSIVIKGMIRTSMKKKTLESFSKADLISLIKENVTEEVIINKINKKE